MTILFVVFGVVVSFMLCKKYIPLLEPYPCSVMTTNLIAFGMFLALIAVMWILSHLPYGLYGFCVLAFTALIAKKKDW